MLNISLASHKTLIKQAFVSQYVLLSVQRSTLSRSPACQQRHQVYQRWCGVL